MPQQITLSVNSEKSGKVTQPKINENNTQYSVDYIKNHWRKDCYIFDLRWYKNNAEREEITILRMQGIAAFCSL